MTTGAETKQPKLDDFSSIDFPSLAGLPELTSKFIRSSASGKEQGAGMIFGALHQDRHRYVIELNEWYYYRVLVEKTNHGVWQLDYGAILTEKAVRRVEDALLREELVIAQEIKDLGKTDEEQTTRLQALRKSILKMVDGLKTERGLRSTLRFARLEMAISADKFDQQPYLLVTRKTTLELNHAAKDRPGRPGDFCTKFLNTEWLGLDHRSNLLDQTLFTIFSEDEEIVTYFWRWPGRALVGDSSIHEILLLVGAGRNGKSLLLEAITRVIGDYGGSIRSEMLTETRFPPSADQPSPSTLDLKGKRLVVASETPDGARFSAARCKHLSGGDELIGRNIQGKHNIRFKPTHHLVLATNFKPKAPANDFAFWQRIRLIEFKRRFLNKTSLNFELGERPADLGLPDKLKQCDSAILAALVRGCLEALRDGLNPPQEVMAAVAGYQASEDLTRQWLDARCEFGDGYAIPHQQGHKEFKIWFAEEVSDSYPAPGPKKWGEELQRFLKKERNAQNSNIYVGARLNADFFN